MDGNYGHFFELARIHSEINKLFDVLIKSQGGAEGSQHWLPNVDIIETDCTVVVRCEIPGVPRGDLRISAQGTALVVEGEKHPPAPDGEAKYHCMERAHGPFHRVVPLPPMVNTRGAKAALANGVLTITLPKVANRRGEKVEIPILEEETIGVS